MEVVFKNGIMKLGKNNINLILDYLNEIAIITIKNLNSFTKSYFKSKIQTLRIYRYVLNYGKSNSDRGNNKVRFLNLMTNSDFLNRAKNLFKVDVNEIISVCYKLADHFNNIEMKILENLK